MKESVQAIVGVSMVIGALVAWISGRDGGACFVIGWIGVCIAL
jgi:hypothetical protein